jgi:DNA-binding beta-propeller fold protein YncE
MTGDAAGQFCRPHSVVYDPQHEEMIVSDRDNDRLQWFHRPTLKHLHSFGKLGERQLGDFDEPSGLCLQPHTRHILVCDANNHRVQVLSNPHYSSSSSSLPIPLCAIGRTNDEGSDEKGRFYFPQGVCCAAHGSITVVDTGNHRVQLVDASLSTQPKTCTILK